MSEEKKEEISKKDLTAWNLSQHDIALIGEFLTRASVYYRAGKIRDCFFDTEEIRGLIHTDLTRVEDQILDKLEDKIHSAYNLKIKYLKKLSDDDEDFNSETDLELTEKEEAEYRARVKRLNNAHTFYIKKYRRAIRELLGKYGYLFSKKEDKEELGF